ncbi:MAG: eukaryotic-like serine/threonine-protein kinase [Verrucomicrobiota bacterium]|jgi:serine/threonine protein kinase|nr:eukaryotic-like serine/threonine-protein kinase [Verrucomicrobiota bacterium]
MNIVGEIVMPPDVILQPVERLPAESLQLFQYRKGDYCITRPRSRIPSSIVDASTAGLLEVLRRPMTFVDAVITYSRAEKLDPRETLVSAFPIVQRFLDAGILVDADSDAAKPINVTYKKGKFVGPLQIIEPVYLMLDTEVYLASALDGSLAALKIARPGAEAKLRASLSREAAMLERLDGKVNPRLIEQGESDGRPFLAISWCRGTDAYDATAESRAASAKGRADVLEVVSKIIAAYAHLHGQGILHGDVHPRNVVVDENRVVTLVDFGLATPTSAANSVPIETRRGCIDLFMDPELARAHLKGQPPPPVTQLSEQYSVATMLYLLITGAHTHDFVLEAREMWTQVAEEPPLGFGDHGVYNFPHIEETLRRALTKDPALRFRSMAEFLLGFSEASSADLKIEVHDRVSPKREAREAQYLLDETLDRLALSGALLSGQLEAPTASLNNGAAGFAYALLKIASIRGDEKLLALADVWSNRALRNLADSPSAFWNTELGITEEVTGNQSFHHTGSGVFCIDALVAQARGDESSHRRSLSAFLAANCHPRSHLDISFGRAGNLLGCASLLDGTAPDQTAEGSGLRSLGDELSSEIWSGLEIAAPVGRASTLKSLGVAHGWAGILYSVLRWHESSGTQLPEGLSERLQELAALATPVGRGLRWPSTVGADQSWGALQSSWCNGAAGFVYLWTTAHRLLGEPKYDRMATGAAWTAFEAPHVGGDLCCGLAGRSYALLNLYKHSGDLVWLDRARRLAESAAASIKANSQASDGLYHGRVGVVLLAADLECPHRSCMPLFEPES